MECLTYLQHLSYSSLKKVQKKHSSKELELWTCSPTFAGLTHVKLKVHLFNTDPPHSVRVAQIGSNLNCSFSTAPFSVQILLPYQILETHQVQIGTTVTFMTVTLVWKFKVHTCLCHTFKSYQWFFWTKVGGSSSNHLIRACNQVAGVRLLDVIFSQICIGRQMELASIGVS